MRRNRGAGFRNFIIIPPFPRSGKKLLGHQKPRRANVGAVIYFGDRSAALPMFDGQEYASCIPSLARAMNVLGVSSGWRAPAVSARATRSNGAPSGMQIFLSTNSV